ncbi:glycoside hydrolase family 15 [Actinobacteria bacterium YIM 96077]|uniref:Glycoside hydrolase family 15 n=2 Tax=Phytoactinopolyspora halophila TaxID=1981511 RepID=A0A329R1P0_9ACTN|nr:glycoside hydrolase family 15 [Actinobacteria bacterium YIM 96077]RAW18584.1 glycoside hydrolase family 15 [Phytoactinopolyspora halophila]
MASFRSGEAETGLYTEAVAITSADERLMVREGASAEFVPGTRVLSDADSADELAEEQLSWLDGATVPDIGSGYSDMIETALLDLHTLTLDNGAALAGWSSRWRYVWPRDAAFIAAALASVDHDDDAARIVHFLQDVQGDDGLFEARYVPDGSGEPPDDRGIQLDGTGWALWAVAQTAENMPAAERPQFIDTVRMLVDRSTRAILRMIDNEQALPPPSPDFWELSEDEVTLGTVGPLLAGLESAAKIYGWIDDAAAADRAAHGAGRLRAAVHREFGPGGYARYADGSDRDAALFYLVPPVAESVHPDVRDAWAHVPDEMRRRAGGLAPGAGWRDDGVSWTPHTAMYALTAAAMGEDAIARETLMWLDEHRTVRGALPEKVLGDGSPAAVAPLSWTAAIVVLTAVELAD